MGGPVPNSAVGPGIGAFLAFFALAVALYFLMRNMNARMRRMAYRERSGRGDRVCRERDGHEVGDERRHRAGVEHLVEAEPAR